MIHVNRYHCHPRTSAVELEHEVVDLALVGGVDAGLDECGANDRVDVVHRMLHTLAVVDFLVLIIPLTSQEERHIITAYPVT